MSPSTRPSPAASVATTPTKATPIGEFLRAPRARIRPEDVNLSDVGARRVAELRCEEVAVLAGVNVDYYARLK
ncbi:MAG: DNA-binding protein [Blastococcus sp.]|nr:DNA-binding protein [Blastococcus sp.]